jgi:hypothetical protein
MSCHYLVFVHCGLAWFACGFPFYIVVLCIVLIIHLDLSIFTYITVRYEVRIEYRGDARQFITVYICK